MIIFPWMNNMKSTTSPSSYQRCLNVYPSIRIGPPKVDMIRRVMGTTDIDGKGTNHPVERQVDPFFIMDEADLPFGLEPPFGSHPHTGLVACTYQLNEKFGGMLWDNHYSTGKERSRKEIEKEYYGPLWGHGLLEIFSGKGIVHDEGQAISPNSVAAKEWKRRFGEALHDDGETTSAASSSSSSEKTKQQLCSFKRKNNTKTNNTTKVNQWLLQFWFNPGIGGTFQRELDPAQVVLANPEQIPVIQKDNVTIRVILGEYQGKKSPGQTWDADLVFLDCTIMPSDVNQETSTVITLPDHYTTAWIFNVKPNEDDNTGSSISIKDYWQAGEYKGNKIHENEDNELLENEVTLKTQELAIREQIDGDGDGGSKKENIPVVAKQGTNKLKIDLQPSSSGALGARFVIGAGKPFGLPWFKLLGNDGALIGPNEEYVRTKMQEFEANKDDFGK